jgi:hypothetical protein
LKHRELHRRRPAINDQNMHQSPEITLHQPPSPPE